MADCSADALLGAVYPPGPCSVQPVSTGLYLSWPAECGEQRPTLLVLQLVCDGASTGSLRGSMVMVRG